MLPKEIVLTVMCAADYRAAESFLCTCKDLSSFAGDFWHAYVSASLGISTLALQGKLGAGSEEFVRALQIVGRGEWDAPVKYDRYCIEVIVHGYDMKQRALVNSFLEEDRIVWHKTITTRNIPGGIPHFPWFAHLREYYSSTPLAARPCEKRAISYPSRAVPEEPPAQKSAAQRDIELCVMI